MYDIKKIDNDIKNSLSQFRYEHSIRVAEEAKKLAYHYNIDTEKAYVAGMVHDIAKEFTIEENEKWINKCNLSKELLNPELKNIIHADIGAVVVKEIYGFDEEICNSVKYHTIGNVSMSLFDKIIFVADMIGRKNISPKIEKIKQLAYKNIDMAVKLCIINQKEKLESRGETVHPEAVKLLKSLENVKE